ncbi:hypothetical protein DsansV1_C11g0112371 [Dioscorea sansibarensis]
MSYVGVWATTDVVSSLDCVASELLRMLMRSEDKAQYMHLQLLAVVLLQLLLQCAAVLRQPLASKVAASLFLKLLYFCYPVALLMQSQVFPLPGVVLKKKMS